MFKLILSFVLLAFLSTNSQAQNLIKNQNFAKGVENWSIFMVNGGVAPRAIEIGSSYQKYGLADNQAGISFAELDAQSAIQQTIITQKDKKYVFSYGFSHRPNAGDKQLIIQVNGKVVHTATIKNNADLGKFAHKNFTFDADSDNAKIAIYVVSLSGDASKGVLVTDIFCNLETEVDLKSMNKI
jgi:hypothetical protein